jgi:hypothetical protein
MFCSQHHVLLSRNLIYFHRSRVAQNCIIQCATETTVTTVDITVIATIIIPSAGLYETIIYFSNIRSQNFCIANNDVDTERSGNVLWHRQRLKFLIDWHQLFR